MWATDERLRMGEQRSFGWAVSWYDEQYGFENILAIAGDYSVTIDVLDTVAWDMTSYEGLVMGREDMYAVIDNHARIWIFAGATDAIEVSDSLYDYYPLNQSISTYRGIYVRTCLCIYRPRTYTV